MKPITLKDFKSWLEGVEDMQEEDWTPTPAQWKKIREKIDQIQETPVPSSQSFTQQPWVSQTPTYQQPSPHIVKPLKTNDVSSDLLPSVKNESSLLTDHVKTPNIDTSDGKYNTNFL